MKHYGAKGCPAQYQSGQSHPLCGLVQALAGYRQRHDETVEPIATRETAINALKPYFTNTVRAIDKSHVDKWAAARSKTASARTVFNIERKTLIQILDYALREGLILENPGQGDLAPQRTPRQGRHPDESAIPRSFSTHSARS